MDSAIRGMIIYNVCVYLESKFRFYSDGNEWNEYLINNVYQDFQKEKLRRTETKQLRKK